MSSARAQLIRLGAAVASAAIVGSPASRRRRCGHPGDGRHQDRPARRPRAARPRPGRPRRDQGQGAHRHHRTGRRAQRGRSPRSTRPTGLGSGQATLVAYLGSRHRAAAAARPDDPGRRDCCSRPPRTSPPSSAPTGSMSWCSRRPGWPPTPTGPPPPRSRRSPRTLLEAQGLENPQNQAQLQPLVDDLQAQIGAATNATNGLAATVLGFTPAQWDADHALLTAPRSADQTANTALAEGSVGRQADTPGPARLGCPDATSRPS